MRVNYFIFKTSILLIHEVRAAILKRLYDQERKKPYSWIGVKDLANEFNLTLEEIEFHLNYLYEKRLIKFQQTLDLGGGLVRISAFGIDAVENPEMFVKDAPFLQQIIIHGDVIDSNILQVDSIKIRNGLNRIINETTDPELIRLIQELISESYKEKPETSKIESIMETIKEKAPDIAAKLLPYVIDMIKKSMGF